MKKVLSGKKWLGGARHSNLGLKMNLGSGHKGKKLLGNLPGKLTPHGKFRLFTKKRDQPMLEEGVGLEEDVNY
jgi:hypothetical protein